MRMPARVGVSVSCPAFSLPAFVLGASTLVALAGAAHADMPKVLDRISPDTPVVALIDSLDKVKQSAALAGEGPDILSELPSDLRDILSIESMDKTQPLALLLWPKEAKAEQPAEEDAMPGLGGNLRGMSFDGVALMPHTDYAKFIAGLKAGEADNGVSSFTLSVPRPALQDAQAGDEGEAKEVVDQVTLFVKDAGQGYAAIGRDKAFLSSYTPATGQLASQVAFLGGVGKAIEARTELMLITNVSKVKDGVAKALDAMEESTMDQLAMMGQAEQAESGLNLVKMVVTNWSRDARVAIVGQGNTEAGSRIEIGTEFAKDSELGTMFAGASNASDALAHVPDVPFMFAVGYDATSTAARALIDGMGSMQPEGAGAVPGMGNLIKSAKNAESFALLMGAPPAGAMGGLFTQTVSYIRTKDPAQMVASAKTTMEAMNNQVQQGTTYKTKYRTGVKELAGVKIDSWEMSMEMDPNDENAQMAQMMQGFIMGAGPMKGFYGATDNAVVSTLAANEPLMAMALDTAKSGKGLGTNELVKMVRGQLPEGSNVEAYVGVKPLGDMALGLASMFMGPIELDIPENMPPVGIGARLGESGVHASLFLPRQVIELGEKLSQQMQEMQGGDFEGEMGDEPMPADDEEGAPPKF